MTAPEPNTGEQDALAANVSRGILDSQENPADWYRVDAQAGESLLVRVNWEQGMGRYIDIELLDSFGAVVSSQMMLAAAPFNLTPFTVPADGPYFVVMRANQGRFGYAVRVDIDADGDNVLAPFDNCPDVHNPDQADLDGDKLGDACDSCSSDPQNDVDNDGICGDIDTCPNDPLNDADGDSMCGDVDVCPNDPANDTDGDGVCGGIDNCPDVANTNQENSDSDILGDACDAYPNDSDNDTLPDAWETQYALNPLDASGVNGAGGDPDADGLDNATEYAAGSDPWAIPAGAVVSSPANSSTLAGPSQVFTWNDAGANLYQLRIGTTPGAYDIAIQQTTGTSQTISGLPIDGSTIYVQLRSRFGTAWNYSDSSNTAWSLPIGAAVSSPANTSTLTGPSQTFTWNDAGANLYQLRVGTTPGAYDIAIQQTTGTSLTISTLPIDGRTLYVQLRSRFGTEWGSSDSSYTAWSLPTAAVIATPAASSTLNGPSQTFTWNNAGANLYQLWVGTTPGAYDIAIQQTTGTSVTISSLPIDGRTLYVQLRSRFGTEWSSSDSSYTAWSLPTAAVITSPAASATLTGPSQTFTWNNAGANLYQLRVGTTPGAYDIAIQQTTGTSQTISTLPIDGRTLYVTLKSRFGTTWDESASTYTAWTVPAAAELTSPVGGLPLSGPSQVFTWNNAGANLYQVWIGSTPGTYNLKIAQTTGTTLTMSGLPMDGSTVYVRLKSRFGTTWVYSDYSYTSNP